MCARVAFCGGTGYNMGMKTFKYKFSKLIKALLAIGIVLSAVGFGLNLFFCIRDGIGEAADPVYPILRYVLMFIVTVVLFILLTSILAHSTYSIDEKYFKTTFGLIVSKYELAKITTVTLNRKTNKLTVTFENGEFMVIVVKQEWYNDFVDNLLKANPKIEYEIESLESNSGDANDQGDNNKKK